MSEASETLSGNVIEIKTFDISEFFLQMQLGLINFFLFKLVAVERYIFWIMRCLSQ